MYSFIISSHSIVLKNILIYFNGVIDILHYFRSIEHLCWYLSNQKQLYSMAPPPQQMYTAPESTFQTPAGIPAWRFVINRLNQYTTAAYAPAQGAAQPNAVRLKPVPVQRQEIDLGTTASDLNFFNPCLALVL